jgi:allantoicase
MLPSQACLLSGTPDQQTLWSELLPYSSPCRAISATSSKCDPPAFGLILKLNIYPDGGDRALARLRHQCYRDWTVAAGNRDLIDLAAALNGGRALICSDEHYGSMGNLLLPGRGASMADGWETRRRREPGFDWVDPAAGASRNAFSTLNSTRHTSRATIRIRSRFTLRCCPEAGCGSGQPMHVLASMLLEPQLLQADCVHALSHAQLRDLGAVSHVRVNMHPDGGLSRVRLFGQPD